MEQNSNNNLTKRDIIAAGAGAAGVGLIYGAVKGVKWVIKKIKTRKCKKNEPEKPAQPAPQKPADQKPEAPKPEQPAQEAAK